MKKLAEKLSHIELELPKWTRKVLYEHLLDVCDNLKEHMKSMNHSI